MPDASDFWIGFQTKRSFSRQTHLSASPSRRHKPSNYVKILDSQKQFARRKEYFSASREATKPFLFLFLFRRFPIDVLVLDPG